MSQSLYPDPPTDPEAAEASRPKGGPGIASDRYPRNLDDLHARLVRWFEDGETTTADGRRLSQRDRDSWDGYQWSSAENPSGSTEGARPAGNNHQQNRRHRSN